ncbi:Serine/threonine protein kinase [Labilithrix luteola]|uniref:Serine/threonine protein kinase n=1 Tax=Labilithrix luteola TaxID=1391654 RepID=A0A0K1PU54_9BACT|nr:serine/threonine-protein kinase [Labilithrix luteola]AKU96896.1 Serine/threonine protein kinase [Labilithrix luteola]
MGTRVLPVGPRPGQSGQSGSAPVGASPSVTAVTGVSWEGSGPVPAMAMPAANARLGGIYEPLLELASGGMARVFIGRRVGAAGFERIVVIKQIHRHMLGREEMHKLFKDEAHIASLIHHVNVVPVIDVVEASGELLLVMEYVESVSMSLMQKMVRLAGTITPPSVIVRVMMDVLAGLQAAHDAVDARGRPMLIVHRDVSPQNVIIGRDGVSRVIDFGVAKAAHRLTETESGHLKGKFGYMAPEQISGQPVDRRTDVFAAGVMLFEAFSDARLFATDNALETMRRVLNEPMPNPATVPRMPPALHDVVKTALSREPNQRFPSAIDFANALAGCFAPATHGEVSQWIEAQCGKLLAQRREVLAEVRSSPSGVGPSTDVVFDASPRKEDGTTQQHVSVERSIEPSLGRRPSRWLWAVLLGATVLTFGVILGIRLATRLVNTSSKLAAASSTMDSPPPAKELAPPPTTTPADVPSDGVVVELRAESPILSVQTSGMRGLELHGKTARLVVEPWSGELVVEARLENKRDARARVSFNGSHSAMLSTAPAGPATGGSKWKKPAAAQPDELQESPYAKGKD